MSIVTCCDRTTIQNEDVFLGGPERAGQPCREMRQRWFPFRFDLAQRIEFKKLGPRKKVILADINCRLSEHFGLYKCGYRGKSHFVEADTKWANRLCLSVESFRASRREIGRDMTGKAKHNGLEWFDYKPGHGDRHGKLYATEYHAARFATIRKGEGVRCAAIDRHTWTVLVAALRESEEPLKHVDLAVYLSLAYLWERCGGSGPGKDSILVRKNEIESLCGIKTAPFMRSLKRLSSLQGSLSNGGARLFDLRISKHGRYWIVEILHWKPIREQKEGIR